MKRKKRERSILEKEKKHYSPLSQLKPEEIGRIEQVKELLLPLQEKYNLTHDEIASLLKEKTALPLSILNQKLTPLESIVKYLKEEKKCSLKEIANILGRDERNIWHIYDQARKKHAERFILKKDALWIPLSIFSKTRLSALEAIVVYLKEETSLNYHEIALLLKRDDRTVWTVYQRARKKNAK